MCIVFHQNIYFVSSYLCIDKCLYVDRLKLRFLSLLTNNELSQFFVKRACSSHVVTLKTYLSISKEKLRLTYYDFSISGQCTLLNLMLEVINHISHMSHHFR